MQRALTALLLAWLAAVAVLVVSREVAGVPHVAALASTPDLVAHGRLWTLLSSALPVGRYPYLEVLGLLGAVYAVWRIAGITAVWVAGLAAHIGATLVVYAVLGGLWLTDRPAAAPFVDRLDYGISAIWLGELGFLAAALWDRNRRVALGVGVGTLTVSVGLAPVTGEMATAEHLLAFTIGLCVPTFFRHALSRSPTPATPSRTTA